jgi:cyclophilin family peptidyl-prolyl cis-trans isomerase
MNKKILIGVIILVLIIGVIGFKMTGNAIKSNPKVLIKTSMGDITLELNQDKAPITVQNFLTYTKEGAYNNTVFHRVIPSFMIQGGGFTTDGIEKPVHSPIKIESDNGLKNDKYTIAMARTSDPNSATNQFFINVADNDFLNYGFRDEGYAVFGKVISGQEVVDKISSVKTTSKNGNDDWPVKDVIIESVQLI